MAASRAVYCWRLEEKGFASLNICLDTHERGADWLDWVFLVATLVQCGHRQTSRSLNYLTYRHTSSARQLVLVSSIPVMCNTSRSKTHQPASRSYSHLNIRVQQEAQGAASRTMIGGQDDLESGAVRLYQAMRHRWESQEAQCGHDIRYPAFLRMKISVTITQVIA
jgi:hypothetical protein